MGLSGEGTLHINPPGVETRHYFAGEHLWTARYNAQRCRDLEMELAGKVTIDIEHRSYCVNAVLASVAFVEALVNETFLDAGDQKYPSPRVAGLSAAVKASMGAWWQSGAYKVSILDKFDKALELHGSGTFAHGKNPYQDAALLIRLRNELVHFEPDWHNATAPAKLDKQLSQKIKQSGLLPSNDGSPWFPIKVLGASCAEWAVASVRALADEWTTRLGITRPYEADQEAWDSLVAKRQA